MKFSRAVQSVALLCVSASALVAQPTYRQANASLPAGLATLTASRTLWQGDASAIGVALQTQGFETIADANPLSFNGVTMQLNNSNSTFFGAANNPLITTEGVRAMAFTSAGATFFGVTNTQAFNSVRLSFTGSEVLDFDNLQWGARTTVTPEPSTLGLLGAGLAGLLTVAARRRRA